MDKMEFAQWTAALKTYYSREKLLPTEAAMDLWFEQLKDLSYEAICIALNKWVLTEQWAPTIANIRKLAVETISDPLPEWEEGWNQVIKAIRHYGMYREDEALESLQGITKEIVKRLGFRNLCLSENIQVDRANFRDIYQRMLTEEKKEAIVPQYIKDKIQSLRLNEAEKNLVRIGGAHDRSET